ncbi:MAG: nucleotide exchange factor GrpE [Desulfobacterales bacterium]|nr:nucleotide exchange factor GrpE [Desulfobacterales bacterium]
MKKSGGGEIQYKKKVAREKEDWVKSANRELVKAILPFVDNLDEALSIRKTPWTPKA